MAMAMAGHTDTGYVGVGVGILDSVLPSIIDACACGEGVLSNFFISIRLVKYCAAMIYGSVGYIPDLMFPFAGGTSTSTATLCWLVWSIYLSINPPIQSPPPGKAGVYSALRFTSITDRHHRRTSPVPPALFSFCFTRARTIDACMQCVGGVGLFTYVAYTYNERSGGSPPSNSSSGFP